ITSLQQSDAELVMPLFFLEEAVSVGYEQALVAGACLIHPGKINFIEDAVADCEPHPAVQVERCPHSRLGAGRPARLDSRPTRSKTGRGITHRNRPSSDSSLQFFDMSFAKDPGICIYA